MSEELKIDEMDDSPETLETILNESLGTHELWLKFYAEHPDAIGKYDETAGGVDHQDYCIKKYNKALRCVNEIETRIAELKAENEQLKTDRFNLARLAADTPQFYNPIVAMQAENLRDEILKINNQHCHPREGGDPKSVKSA